MKHTLFLIILACTFLFELNAQVVEIPDSVFKSILLANEKININKNSTIETAEAAAFHGELWIGEKGITNLQGIQAFTSITLLVVNGNQLTSLDLTANDSLRIVYCSNNQIKDLKIGKKTQLRELFCEINQLTELDVSQASALRILYCYANLLTDLDLSGNPELTSLAVYKNQLTELDLSYNPKLSWLSCRENLISTLNLSENAGLEDLNCDLNLLAQLDLTNNPALVKLSCDNNLLTYLDVSENTALQSLSCDYNQLTALDVSENTGLQLLSAGINRLNDLDVSSNGQLTNLSCQGNQLTALNAANNNNENFTFFNAFNNPGLTCIQVDDAEYSNANWTGFMFIKDPGTAWSEHCQETTPAQLISEITTFSVYPNPAKDYTTVSDLPHGSAVLIFDAAGKVVYSPGIATGREFIIDTSKFENGIYLIRNQNGKHSTHRKLVIQ